MTKDEAIALAGRFLATSGSDWLLDNSAVYFGEPPPTYGLRSGQCWIVPLQPTAPRCRAGGGTVLLVCL